MYCSKVAVYSIQAKKGYIDYKNDDELCVDIGYTTIGEFYILVS